jgi:formylglycine-generating enzyme required for sulfatase activity
MEKVERKYLALAVVSCVLWASAAQATVSMDLVPVGDVGNANDPATGYGQVNYAYNIGKYDVTAGQYTAFLNAVAATSDPQGLYNANMASGFASCGISQTFTAGHYVYATTKNANYPANYVSFWDSCRFTNWLQNGQPTNVTETVGTTETGAYDLTNAAAITNNTVTRTTGASWAVASENEWYKAAYYDPTLNSGAGGYWLYPTRSNTAPSNTLADAATNPNDANYNKTDPTNYLTPMGTFAASPSAYGTFDEGGDVIQWNDAIIYGSSRVLRGGSFDNVDGSLQSSSRYESAPAHAIYNIGFRVSQVPEPASAALLGLGVSGMLLRRRGAGK